MPNSSFAYLLSDVGQLLGMPALAPGDDGVCQLVFDSRHVVTIVNFRARGYILLSCAVSSSGITAAQAMLMASSNFMQAAGGTVACTAPDGRLTLQLGVPQADCQATRLLSAIECLLDQVEIWESNLSRAAPNVDNAGGELALNLRTV